MIARRAIAVWSVLILWAFTWERFFCREVATVALDDYDVVSLFRQLGDSFKDAVGGIPPKVLVFAAYIHSDKYFSVAAV